MSTIRDKRPGQMCRACLDDHELILGKLGPMPDAALRAMAGYGLSDQEMARYFGVTPSSLRRLKRSLNVSATLID
ncbi:antitoxin Xre-like helix-turn-helix domain-containing protein [Rhodovulum euryhalinum]|uniref:Antitoxin Xre-like helix-turn-helix domain-containing protein n=1 Tax=Rhodovulum euryhalinum TaxID=35805 RepID=A0A4R2KIL5_9RHOB|nr:antitoxin Xre-like helix-turn-helix domain-containing protein [Rhodovulum euryhalinum]TCO73034.1 hypothetical protein EV655_103263 [Rhodovulum euryhalinum]